MLFLCYPKCSTCQKAKAWLEERSISYDLRDIKQNNPTADMVYRLFEHYRDGDLETGLNMFDSTAVGYLLAPELYTTVDCFVGIETASPLTRGMTVCDLENRLGRTPNAKVCTAVDPAGFQKLFLDALASANGIPENPTAALWLYDEE